MRINRGLVALGIVTAIGWVIAALAWYVVTHG